MQSLRLAWPNAQISNPGYLNSCPIRTFYHLIKPNLILQMHYIAKALTLHSEAFGVKFLENVSEQNVHCSLKHLEFRNVFERSKKRNVLTGIKKKGVFKFFLPSSDSILHSFHLFSMVYQLSNQS